MSPTPPVPADLAALLSPSNTEDFLENGWGERYVLVPGVPRKFAGLLPWPVLNSVLEQHRLEPPRLRLTRDGKPVPPDFLYFQPNRRASGRPIPRLNATALTRELREGATLVLDAVDELYQPLTALAESLESVFRVRIQINAYAGWRTCHGFDVHWDDHDVFILQVAGRKHWKIFGTTRKYALARDVEPATEPPSRVLWEGLLNDGDLLYIPRGWWHVATPLDEPTLHLTVGVNNPTGADLLSWFTGRLPAAEAVRRDIPHLSSRQDRAAWLEELRHAFLERWHSGLIEEYLADLDSKSRPRPRLALPWSATPNLVQSAGNTVCWNGARRLALQTSDGELILDANGRRWRFAEGARPLLEVLLSGREISVDELSSTAAPALDRETVLSFVRELIKAGLIVSVSHG